MVAVENNRRTVKVKTNVMKIMTFAAGLVLAVLMFGVPATAWAKDASMGSPDFRPSAEHPVGWRGDGSGHFPGATPPLNWSYKDGKGSNIIWQLAVPFPSPSSVIVAGEKLFVTGNPYYLFCLDKRTGKTLWVRTVSPYDAATKEDRAANKDAFEKMDKLALARDELLVQMPAPGTTGSGNWRREYRKTARRFKSYFAKLTGQNTKARAWASGAMAGTWPARPLLTASGSMPGTPWE